MAQEFDSLQSYTIGASIFTSTPFTLQTGPGGDWTYTFVDIGGGVKAIRITRTATAQALSRILWTPTIQTVSTTGALEVYARVSKNTTADLNVPIGPCLIFSDGRIYGWRAVSSGATWRLGLFSATGTHNTSIGAAAISFADPSDQTPFHMVIGVRIDPGPTRVIYGKLWNGAVSDEGSAVSMEGTNATLNDLSPGIAVLDSSDVPYQFYSLGIGNAGSTAPREPLASGVEGDLAATEGADTAAIAGEVEVQGDLAATEGADVAAIAGAAGPVITDVDEDNVITSTQTNVEIDGSNFQTGTVEIRQGAVEIEQSVDSTTPTAIVFDVVFDAGGGPHLKYGAATLAVIHDADSQEDTIGITIDAPSGRSFVDLDEPNTTADNRITAAPDLEEGDQLEISNVQGGTIADVTVNADATFDCEEGVTSFDVRVWDVGDATWSAAATQTISIEGDVVAIEQHDTAAAEGSVPAQGDLAAIEDQDVAAIAGEVDVQGDLSATEGPDVAAISGEVDVTGEMAAVEGSDVAAIEGSVPAQGDLAVTEASDTAAIDGQVIVQGDLAAIEGSDTAAFNGTNDIVGSMAATEAPDTAAIAGSVPVQGDLAVVESGQDVAAVAGAVLVSGALAVTEANDIAAIVGEVEQQRTGALAVTDAPDIASITGEVPQPTGEELPRADLPYATSEAIRFGVSTGRFRNTYRRTVGTKNGTAQVTYVENVETTPPKSVITGEPIE